MLEVVSLASADSLGPARGMVEVDPDRPLATQIVSAAGAAPPDRVVDFAIDAWGADALLDRHPRPMSRGEHQLCSLLITIATPTGALALVDPTAGLDARRRWAVAALLADLALDRPISIASDDPVFDRYRSGTGGGATS